MGIITLYLGMVVLGYIVGSKLKKKEIELKWTGKIQLVAIIVLVFMMGSRIGADETVIASLGTIGVTAAVITAMTLAGSVLAVFLARKAMKIDKEGGKIDD